mgnify:CR=1 FL=1
MSRSGSPCPSAPLPIRIGEVAQAPRSVVLGHDPPEVGHVVELPVHEHLVPTARGARRVERTGEPHAQRVDLWSRRVKRGVEVADPTGHDVDAVDAAREALVAQRRLRGAAAGRSAARRSG